MADILRALRHHYPNLQQVYVSSRTYGGFAASTLNPEPYAYESGFAVKWLVQAQVEQMRSGTIDAHTGDIDYDAAAPWVAWGPYLWAGDASNPRADGFYWTRQDFSADGTHPSQTGRRKVGQLLLDFLLSSPQASPWFAR
jgi:hypothetical protein